MLLAADLFSELQQNTKKEQERRINKMPYLIIDRLCLISSLVLGVSPKPETKQQEKTPKKTKLIKEVIYISI